MGEYKALSIYLVIFYWIFNAFNITPYPHRYITKKKINNTSINSFFSRNLYIFIKRTCNVCAIASLFFFKLGNISMGVGCDIKGIKNPVKYHKVNTQCFIFSHDDLKE
jgi:hypothetical protein